MGFNAIESIPREIWKATSLESLDLQQNRVHEMHVAEEDMNHLTRFTGLLLHSNSLTSVPSEISALMQLRILTLNSNQITEIPSELMKLTNLMELSFSRNPCSIPVEVFTLEKLTRLGCGGCGVALTQISTSIGK